MPVLFLWQASHSKQIAASCMCHTLRDQPQRIELAIVRVPKLTWQPLLLLRAIMSRLLMLRGAPTAAFVARSLLASANSLLAAASCAEGSKLRCSWRNRLSTPTGTTSLSTGPALG